MILGHNHITTITARQQGEFSKRAINRRRQNAHSTPSTPWSTTLTLLGPCQTFHEGPFACSLQRSRCTFQSTAAPGACVTPVHSTRGQAVLSTQTVFECTRARGSTQRTTSGRPNSTDSSTRSLMAASRSPGRLVASTSMKRVEASPVRYSSAFKALRCKRRVHAVRGMRGLHPQAQQAAGPAVRLEWGKQWGTWFSLI